MAKDRFVGLLSCSGELCGVCVAIKRQRRDLTRRGTALTDLLARLRGLQDYRSHPALLTQRPVSLPTGGGSYPASPLLPGLRSVNSKKNGPVTHW